MRRSSATRSETPRPRAATRSANARRSPSSRRARPWRQARPAPATREPAAGDRETDSVRPARRVDGGDGVAARRVHVLGLPQERRIVAHPVEPDERPRPEHEHACRAGCPRGSAVAPRQEKPHEGAAMRPSASPRPRRRSRRHDRHRLPAIAPRKRKREEQADGEVAPVQPLQHHGRRQSEHETAPVADAEDPQGREHNRPRATRQTHATEAACAERSARGVVRRIAKRWIHRGISDLDGCARRLRIHRKAVEEGASGLPERPAVVEPDRRRGSVAVDEIELPREDDTGTARSRNTGSRHGCEALWTEALRGR